MNSHKSIFVLLFSSMLLITTNAHAGTIGVRLDQALQELAPNDDVPIIIRFKDRINSKQFKENNKSLRKSQRRAKFIRELRGKSDRNRSLSKSILAASDAKAEKSLWLINGIAVTVPAKRIATLAKRPWIESIVLDAKLAAPISSIGESSVAGWNLSAIGAPELWQLGFTGQGVVIASLDTGVDINHADLGPKYRGGTNSWFDPYGQYASPTDTDGHGTNSMGLIVGGDSSGQVIGVAPDAQWIAAKIFDNTGVASYSAIHQAMQWVLDPDGNPDVDDAPDVVNNSWGFFETVDTCFTEFADDIAMLKDADIAVVFSAGNSGPYASTSLSPANNPGSVAVGAVDSSLTVASFSSRGPSACDAGIYPHISAPGMNVLTTTLTFGGLFPQSYIEVSGTSFSVAHVAGSMALLKSAVPNVAVADLEAAIEQSAMDLGIPGADNDYGAGVIDVMGAYNLIAGSPPPPQPGDLQFGNAVYSQAENGGILSVTVNRTGGSAGAVTVDYGSMDGTAMAGADYQAASGTISFADGEVSQTLSITLVDDLVYEGDEVFSLQLSNPTGGAQLGTPASATVTIVDDELPPNAGMLEFSSASYSVNEDGGFVTITVNRVGGSYGAVSVDYDTSDGTATAGLDYSTSAGSLYFADGVVSQTFYVSIIDDAIYEGNEVLNLVLSNVSGGADFGAVSSAILTIVDQDPQILDNDGDGYEAGVDCNDNNASIYPGAPEIKHDGIDQDCNGYDLTIDVTRALYRMSQDKLIVYATSDYQDQASLSVTITLASGGSITRTMTWKAAQNRWQRTISGFSRFGSPVSVLVTGPEGAESAQVILN